MARRAEREAREGEGGNKKKGNPNTNSSEQAAEPGTVAAYPGRAAAVPESVRGGEARVAQDVAEQKALLPVDLDPFVPRVRQVGEERPRQQQQRR